MFTAQVLFSLIRVLSLVASLVDGCVLVCVVRLPLFEIRLASCLIPWIHWYRVNSAVVGSWHDHRLLSVVPHFFGRFHRSFFDSARRFLSRSLFKCDVLGYSWGWYSPLDPLTFTFLRRDRLTLGGRFLARGVTLDRDR
jgi:hypothetical protein